MCSCLEQRLWLLMPHFLQWICTGALALWKTTGKIARKFGMDIHGPQNMIPNHFGDLYNLFSSITTRSKPTPGPQRIKPHVFGHPMTFPLAPPSGKNVLSNAHQILMARLDSFRPLIFCVKAFSGVASEFCFVFLKRYDGTVVFSICWLQVTSPHHLLSLQELFSAVL